MTVRLLAAYGIYPANAIVTLDTGTETGLITAKLASANLTGGVAYTAPAAPNQLSRAQVVKDGSGNVLGLADANGNLINVGAATATITGTGVVGSPLTAKLPDGYVGTLQFTRSTKATTPVKTNISGAVANAVNSLAYTPVSGDTAYNIGCDTSNVVAPSATVGVTTAPSSDVAPAVVTAAAITGTPQQGVALSITGATFSGSPTPTVTRVIRMDGTQVASGNQSTGYTPLAGDVGKIPSVTDTASNGVGSPATSTGAGAAVIAAAVSATLRQVATRSQYPDTNMGGLQAYGSTTHKMRDSISAIALGDTGYFGQSETGQGAAATIRRAVEYPIGSGVLVPMTYSGSTTGTIPDGGDLLSDMTPLGYTIPAGADFKIWTYRACSTGILCTRGGARAMTFDTSVDALVSSGAASPSIDLNNGTQAERAALGVGDLSDTLIAYTLKPMVILGMSSIPAVAICGDSRTAVASLDFVSDNMYLAGPGERMVGKAYAFMNLAAQGEKAFDWVTGTQGAKRKAYIQYAGTNGLVFNNYGTNDTGTGTEAEVIARDAAFADLPEMSGKRMIRATIPAQVSSSDFCTTAAGQSPSGLPLVHVALNAARLANTDGKYEYCFDFASVSNIDQTATTRWKVAPRGRTVGASLTAGSATGVNDVVTLDPATAAGNQFAADDIGYIVMVAGGGSGGVQYRGRVAEVLDGFRARCVRIDSLVAAPPKYASITRPAGTSCRIQAMHYSSDGIHEAQAVCIAAQAALQLQARL